MKANKDIILYTILSLTIFSTIYLYTKLTAVEDRNVRILQQLIHTRSGKIGKAIDPCIQKQVKNTITKNQKQIYECYTEYLTWTSQNKPQDVVNAAMSRKP